MRKTLVLIALAFASATGSHVYAQLASPPGAGDKDLRDTDVKRRSIEMERIERDAKKRSGKPAKSQAPKNEDRLAAKYAEIKTDYEQIQLSQNAIVKAYQTGGKIDYAQIGKSAGEINKSAARLNANLFPVPIEENANSKEEEKKKDKTEKQFKTAKSTRDLIIDLDGAIGSFATSSMFQNLRVVDPQVSAKTKLDLEKIIELSALLDFEARKLAATDK